MQILRRCALGLIPFLAALSLGAQAADRATPREARAMFDRAVKYMEANGAERAFAAFNNQAGEFKDKDLYVFALDTNGVYHASGAAPEALVGLNVLETTDAAGNPLIRNMIDATRSTPEATVHYMWLSRSANRVEPKVSYVRRMDGYIVGVGYYAPRASEQEAQKMLAKAVAYAESAGTDKAAAAFNDRNGDFVKDDLYVFMIGLDSGRYEAMGMNPDLTGKDAMKLTDAEGNALVEEMVAQVKEKGEGLVNYVWRNPVTNAVEKKRSYLRKVGDSLIGVGHYVE